MRRFLARRLALAVPTLFGVTVVVFITIKIIPGNPVASLTGVNSTPAIREALMRRLGLDSPLPVQYFDWLRSVVSGDFGISIARQVPVRPLVLGAFGNTLVLAAAGAVVALLGGVVVGGTGALWGRRLMSSHGERGFGPRGLHAAISVALLLLVVLSVDNTVFPLGRESTRPAVAASSSSWTTLCFPPSPPVSPPSGSSRGCSAPRSAM